MLYRWYDLVINLEWCMVCGWKSSSCWCHFTSLLSVLDSIALFLLFLGGVDYSLQSIAVPVTAVMSFCYKVILCARDENGVGTRLLDQLSLFYNNSLGPLFFFLFVCKDQMSK